MNDERLNRLETVMRGAAVATIRLLRPHGGAMKTASDQGVRASSSAFTQAIEALGRKGRDQANRLQCAYAEAREAAGVLQLFVELGDVDAKVAGEALELWDRSRAMIWRRLNPR